MTPHPARREGRRTLTLFILLHFGSLIGFAVGGTAEDTTPRQPAGLRVLHRAWEAVQVRYLDLTATRQRSMLVTPHPGPWASSVRVVAYYPPAGPAASVRSDTLRLTGTGRVPVPRFSNEPALPDEPAFLDGGWEEFYGPFFAGSLCSSVSDARGGKPAALELAVEWERPEVPWDDARPRRVEVEPLGSYVCRSMLGDPDGRPVRLGA